VFIIQAQELMMYKVEIEILTKEIYVEIKQAFNSCG
jgi:hypothetical protein